MLKTVYIIEKTDTHHSDTVAAEMRRAVESLREEGFTSGILTSDSAPEEAGTAAETLYLCGCGSMLRELLDRGACAIGYANADNAGEDFSGAPYIVQEPDLVDADSYASGSASRISTSRSTAPSPRAMRSMTGRRGLFWNRLRMTAAVRGRS